MAQADVQVTFGADISQIGTASNAVKAQLRELGADAENTSGSIHGATVGTAFWTRELRALGDELSSGRYRQADGTFLNLAVHAVQAGGAWAVANPVLIALGAAATAAAGAVAYLVYESIAANNAMKNLELAAVIAQYQLTNEQASALRDTIEQFAGVGASDAAEIAKPFVALGEGGGLIATQLAPSLQLLAENMGQKVPEAAKELSKYFADLSGKGRALVAATNGVNSAQLQAFNHFVQTGQTGKAYLLVIDALTSGVADFAAKQNLANAELKDSIPSLEAAESGVMGLSRAQSDIGGAVAATTAKLAAQRATLEAGRQALESVAASDQKAYEAANKTADAIDKQGTEITRLKSQIEVLGTGLTKAMASANPDPISIEHWRAAILQAQRDLEEMTSKQGSLFGGVAQQVDHALKEVQDKFKGSKAVELQVEIKTITSALDKGGVPEKDRQTLQDQLAAKQAALRETESAATIKAAEEEAAAELKLYTDAASQREAILDGELRRRQVTTAQWLAGAKDALADELQDTIATYQAELQAIVGTSEAAAQQRKAISDKIAEATAANAVKVQKAEEKASDETTKSWMTAADQIASIMNSQVNGLLRGTESIKTAFKNMAASIIEDLIKVAIKLAVEAAAMEALSLATGGALGGFGAGGLGGFLAGALHFAEGTPYVQNTGYAVIHQGEMVVPAQMNPNNPANSNSLGGGSFGNSGAAGGGGIGGSVTSHHASFGDIHVHNSGRELDPDALAGAIQKAHRGGHFNRR